MACQHVYTWSFSDLVAAFLDLFIAYFLLCASAVTFMASRFLGVFGLSLPCPCDGVFGHRNLCFQKLFIEYPLEKVANIHLSVRSRFPFSDSVWIRHQNCDLNLGLIREKERKIFELDGEASCSETSIVRKSSDVIGFNGELEARNEFRPGVVKLLGKREGRFDMKGKGVMHHKLPRSGLRRRRRGSFDHGKCSSDASCELAVGGPESPPGFNSPRHIIAEDDIVKCCDASDNEEAPVVMKLGQAISGSIDMIEVTDDDGYTDEDLTSVQVLDDNDKGRFVNDNGDKNSKRLLEQALEEQNAAYAAVWLELEKERSAAASAAEEAMAMIQRLQQEKASIEIDARQYERILEEKAAYDAEEMNILEEIIIHREREKHFLEKEIEAYRQILHAGFIESADNEGNAGDIGAQISDSPFDSSEDLMVMLYQLSASLDKKGMIGGRNSYEVISTSDQTDPSWENQPIQEEDEDTGLKKKGDFSQFVVHGNDGYQELQARTVAADKSSFTPPENVKRQDTVIWSRKLGSSNGNFPQENLYATGRDKECINEEEPHGIVDRALNEEPYVHDVHVIAGQSNSLNQVGTSKRAWMPISSASEVHERTDVSSEAFVCQQFNTVSNHGDSSRLDAEVDVTSSSSDVSGRLLPKGRRGESLQWDSNRVIENERRRLDNEIGWLREKLKIVQEGRGKLNLSMEHGEMGRRQLSLLEDIAQELQEIRQLTERGKAVRQASLPLPSSKVISKKRRCRSVSLGQQTS